MNLCNASMLNLLSFGIILAIYTLIGEVVVYIPIAMILLVKSYQVTVKTPALIKQRGLYKSINFFLLVAFVERVMVVNGMTILSYYTSFLLLCAASYLVINIDHILSKKVSDETIISIIISYLYLLFLYCYPLIVPSISFTVWLVIVVSLYFTFTNQMVSEVNLTSSQVMLVEQSQWSLFIYSLFRLISNIFEVKFQLSLIFYICALVLFLGGAFTIIKQYKLLNTLRVANLSSCLLLATLGVECFYYVIHN